MLIFATGVLPIKSTPPTFFITEVTQIINYPAGTTQYFGNAYTNLTPIYTVINDEVYLHIIIENYDDVSSHTINSITVATHGFKIISLSPPTPQTVSSLSLIGFGITLSMPNFNFNGILTIVINVS